MAHPAGFRASWWEGRHPQNTSYWQTNFPCRAACPVNTNAGGYVSLIAQRRYRDAYLLAYLGSILGGDSVERTFDGEMLLFGFVETTIQF